MVSLTGPMSSIFQRTFNAPPTTFTGTLGTSSFAATHINAVAYNGTNLWVIVGDAGKLATSPNGFSWTQRTSSFGTTDIHSVHYAGLWVIVGELGKIATSSDGFTWAQQTSPFGTTTVNDVYNGAGLWIAVGDSGKMASSSDGTSWSLVATSSFGTDNIRGVFHDQATLWVATGSTPKLATSINGATWVQRTLVSGVYHIDDVAFNGSVYTAVGGSSSSLVLQSSPDGITWTVCTISGIAIDQAYCHDVAFNGFNLSLAVGGLDDTNPGFFPSLILSSTNGTSWASQPSPFGFSAILGVAHNQTDLWVLVGEDGKLATSP